MLHQNSVIGLMQLTTQQTADLCYAINQFGTGDHPWAGPGEVEYFDRGYARECVTYARDANLAHAVRFTELIDLLS